MVSDRFCANSRQRSDRFSHENSRQDSIQCSASSEFGDIIKSEQDETLQHDNAAEWNGSSSRKNVRKFTIVKLSFSLLIALFMNYIIVCAILYMFYTVLIKIDLFVILII
jgi:hypothetical protein